MPYCLIGLGSNQGDRIALITAAIARIGDHFGVALLSQSRIHETRPIGGPEGQGPFLNAAILVATNLPPEVLLATLLEIERSLGRDRAERWGARRIDLDLLLYGERVIRSGGLEVPHPRMAWRRFVLAPAAEVAPEMRHPVIGWTVRELLVHLDAVRPYIALAGAPGSGKGILAENLARSAGGRLIRDPATSIHRPSIDSSGTATRAELEFIRCRTGLLATDSALWNEPVPLWVSDFWFGQTLAYARAALPKAQQEEVEIRWRQAAVDVCPPKLTVLVDAPAEWCTERVRREQRASGAAAGSEIAAVRQAILETLDRPGWGPVLRLDGRAVEQASEELSAAVDAMN